MTKPGERTKVVIIVSDVDRVVGFEWLVDNIDRSRFKLSFILLNAKPSYLAGFLKDKNVPCFELTLKGKKDVPLLVLKVAARLRRIRPDVVHTHLFGANLVGQTAAWLARVPKRIYTRHSSNENRRYHGKQHWDHYTNRRSTDIVAISENVRNILINEENVLPEKITLVHHGLDLDSFALTDREAVEQLRAKYNPENRSPVIGVIARYSHWKGIQFVIPAFKRLLADQPNALLILANACRADYADELKQMLTELPLESYCEIEFEPDIFSLYRLFDVYVHVPIDAELEAFGLTYVEALAACVPSVFTLSGVAPEFIVDRKNALVVDFQNSDQVYDAVTELLADHTLAAGLIDNGKQDVRAMFSLGTMIRKLEDLYSS